VLEQEIPLESLNREDSTNINKGEEKMVVPVNVSPFHRDVLKEAEVQLKSENGERVVNDAQIVERAVKIFTEGKVVDLTKLEGKFSQELEWLRAHPKGWDRVVLSTMQEISKDLKIKGVKLKDPIEDPYTDH